MRYRLGKAWVELAEPTNALHHLTACEAIATEAGDLQAQGRAFAALAAAYQALEDDSKVSICCSMCIVSMYLCQIGC